MVFSTCLCVNEGVVCWSAEKRGPSQGTSWKMIKFTAAKRGPSRVSVELMKNSHLLDETGSEENLVPIEMLSDGVHMQAPSKIRKITLVFLLCFCTRSPAKRGPKRVFTTKCFGLERNGVREKKPLQTKRLVVVPCNSRSDLYHMVPYGNYHTIGEAPRSASTQELGTVGGWPSVATESWIFEPWNRVLDHMVPYGTIYGTI